MGSVSKLLIDCRCMENTPLCRHTECLDDGLQLGVEILWICRNHQLYMQATILGQGANIIIHPWPSLNYAITVTRACLSKTDNRFWFLFEFWSTNVTDITRYYYY